jgi:hypothetical protein
VSKPSSSIDVEELFAALTTASTARASLQHSTSADLTAARSALRAVVAGEADHLRGAVRARC